ncbi:cyclophilin-like fold protein [Brachyspira pilosicoli]|uniref:Cyclophilin-like fold protein n=1 Tax=Brachyspira pilosicoli TaxID=52584 RepID=A0AAJ6GH29_BRAPL|nr:cyclophilin-like fold protein [Brachyspira pilosicoli]WIH90334.1 cyclophilin-like fold protein [Brachyspira pilosicoli]WIH92625.1 cyclophilin-like fold protein [Brachyspira pilosicoli]WIH94915.1 cyclophilin-like fold protein [Brachyspira pilosicoli]
MRKIIITFFIGLFAMNAFAQNTRIKLTFEGNEIYALINNSKAGNDFLSLLPLSVKAEDFNSTEKIFYLSKKLNTQNEPDGINPKAGDITYYAPWGNIAIFYKNFRYSNNLIYLGKFENTSDVEKLSNIKGNFDIRIERVN